MCCPTVEKSVMGDLKAAIQADDMARVAIEKMRGIRVAYDISQQKLSEMSGIPVSSISSYETGNNSPTLRSFCRLLACLNVEEIVFKSMGGEVIRGFLIGGHWKGRPSELAAAEEAVVERIAARVFELMKLQK